MRRPITAAHDPANANVALLWNTAARVRIDVRVEPDPVHVSVLVAAAALSAAGRSGSLA